MARWRKIDFEIQLTRLWQMLVAVPLIASAKIGNKGKSAIQIARNFQGRKKNFVGQHFWARGYYVSTVGREHEDQRIDQLNLFE